jgi:hypothetical protein
LNAPSAKLIVVVTTGRGETAAIAATTALESTPPDRNAPSGTSAIIRSLTASEKIASNCSSHAASRRGGTARYVGFQYSSVVTRPSSHTR